MIILVALSSVALAHVLTIIIYQLAHFKLRVTLKLQHSFFFFITLDIHHKLLMILELHHKLLITLKLHHKLRIILELHHSCWLIRSFFTSCWLLWSFTISCWLWLSLVACMVADIVSLMFYKTTRHASLTTNATCPYSWSD